MLRFSTAGESHGESLVALLSGLPAGIPVDQSFLDHELWRRQQGYGRGGRMRIERDTAHILSGVRHGKTIGSPIAMTLANRDWKNWEDILPVAEGDPEKHKAVASPRPGHADLAGARSSTTSPTRVTSSSPRQRSRVGRPRRPAEHWRRCCLKSLDIQVASHARHPRRRRRTLPRGDLR